MKPRLVLYHPKSNSSGKCILPMTLLALGAVLEEEYEYVIVDGNIIHDPALALNELIRDRGYNTLGVTVMPGPQTVQAIEITRHVRARYPHVTTIWGGYFPSQHTETVLQAPYVDFVVRSQGETTLLELLHALERGGDLRAINSLSFKRDGSIVHNPARAIISPEQFPPFPYHRLDMQRYLYQTFMGKRVTEHHSSYGCPFACNFCAVVSMVNRRWLSQSPARMEATLWHLKTQYGVDGIHFHDMDFFVSEARVAEFAERISVLGTRWWALGRVDTLLSYKDSTWEKLRSSGCRMIFSGAESGSDNVLIRMNKGGSASAQSTLEYVKRARAYDIIPELSFVLGNPPDPEADIQASLKLIRQLKQVNPATELVLYLYTPVPLDGTLYDQAREMGFSFPATLDEWTSPFWREFVTRREPRTPWADPESHRRVRDFERVLNAFYPTSTDTKMVGLKRALLRSLAAWRYHLEFYAAPLELRAFQRLFRYRRPETAGF